MMNNLDVSLMNVLQSQHGDIFNSYFNNVGSIPNLSTSVREKAKTIFKKYSTQDFDQFMQKYRTHKAGTAKNSCPRQNISKCTQTIATVPQEHPEDIIFEENESPININYQDNIFCQASTSETLTFEERNLNDGSNAKKRWHASPSFRSKRSKEKFDALKFLEEKNKKKAYIYLDFQSEKIEEFLTINGCMDIKKSNRLAEEALKKMAEYLGILNRRGSYRILDVHLKHS